MRQMKVSEHAFRYLQSIRYYEPRAVVKKDIRYAFSCLDCGSQRVAVNFAKPHDNYLYKVFPKPRKNVKLVLQMYCMYCRKSLEVTLNCSKNKILGV